MGSRTRGFSNLVKVSLDNTRTTGDLQSIAHLVRLEDISIDFGLMERAGNVAVVPANFEWDDVGAWDALARTREPDADGNVQYYSDIYDRDVYLDRAIKSVREARGSAES